jgi:uncharacterized cupin superfamily protein
VVPEAPLERKGEGVGPAAEGWYVLNVRDARWFETEGFDAYAWLESDAARFPEIGISVSVLPPGRPSCMYHREDTQEDFLIVSGEALLLVEGEERRVKSWDLVHCPAGTNHVLVGGDNGPCVLVGMGKRPTTSVTYSVDETARRHGACVEQETSSPKEAYTPFPRPAERAHRDGDLPELA